MFYLPDLWHLGRKFVQSMEKHPDLDLDDVATEVNEQRSTVYPGKNIY